MEGIANVIIFYLLAAAIIVSSVLAVTSRKIFRAATYLLLVLIGTAGLYLMLNYHFLAVVQLSVYAGGILILFIFAILLTSSKGDRTEPHDRRRVLSGAVTALAGLLITTWVTLKHRFLYGSNPTVLGDHETDMKAVGQSPHGDGQVRIPAVVRGAQHPVARVRHRRHPDSAQTVNDKKTARL